MIIDRLLTTLEWKEWRCRDSDKNEVGNFVILTLELYLIKWWRLCKLLDSSKFEFHSYYNTVRKYSPQVTRRTRFIEYEKLAFLAHKSIVLIYRTYYRRASQLSIFYIYRLHHSCTDWFYTTLSIRLLSLSIDLHRTIKSFIDLGICER